MTAAGIRPETDAIGDRIAREIVRRSAGDLPKHRRLLLPRRPGLGRMRRHAGGSTPEAAMEGPAALLIRWFAR